MDPVRAPLDEGNMRPSAATIAVLVGLLALVPAAHGGYCRSNEFSACASCSDSHGRCTSDSECAGSTGCSCVQGASPSNTHSSGTYGGMSRTHLCGSEEEKQKEEVEGMATMLVIIGSFMGVSTRAQSPPQPGFRGCL